MEPGKRIIIKRSLRTLDTSSSDDPIDAPTSSSDDPINDGSNVVDGYEASVLSWLEDKERDLETLDLSPHPEFVGHLDMAFLVHHGYRNLHTLKFPPGKILSLRNLPKTLKTLDCGNNLLTTIHIPAHLEHLAVPHNQISEVTWDKGQESQLKTWNIGYNRLKVSPPIFLHVSQLVELTIDGNDVTHMDLSEMDALKILHCRGNPQLHLEHVSEGIDIRSKEEDVVDMDHALSDNNAPLSDDIVGNPRRNNRSDIHTLDDYYTMKDKQETNLQKRIFKLRKMHEGDVRELPGKIKEIKLNDLPCVACGRKGAGTLFRRTQAIDTGIVHCEVSCGAKEHPCSLRWSIPLNTKDESATLYELNVAELNVARQSSIQAILQQKCASLYAYEPPKASTAKFEEEYDKYLVLNDEYERARQAHNHRYTSRTNDAYVQQELVINELLQEFRQKVEEIADSPRSWKGTSSLWSEAMHLRGKLVQEKETLDRWLISSREMEPITDYLGQLLYCQLRRQLATSSPLDTN